MLDTIMTADIYAEKTPQRFLDDFITTPYVQHLS